MSFYLTSFFDLFICHRRSSAAPPAGDGVCIERSLPASGCVSGHLQWAAQCAVPALRDRDHAGAAPPAPAKTWRVSAQHCPEGGLHTAAANTRHQHGVRAQQGAVEELVNQKQCNTSVFPCVCRTYADKLSPKVVQSLLDLLCSQLKNLLSQAGVSLLHAGKEQEDGKHEDSADSERKDFRGETRVCCHYICVCLTL